MKELVAQNERRFLEIQHVKSQLEVTKKSLQTLQDETAMQRSLLEAELRRREGLLKELESQETVKCEQLTDATTQGSISEYTEVRESELELQVTDTDKSAIENGQPVSGFQEFDEPTADVTLSPEEHNSVTGSVYVNENDPVPIFYPSSENSQLSETSAPIQEGDIPPVQLLNIFKQNDGMGGDASSKESEKACDFSQPNTETNSRSYKSEENVISIKGNSDDINLPCMKESIDEAMVSQAGGKQMLDIPLLPVRSNDSHVAESFPEPDKDNHPCLPVTLEEEHISPTAPLDERKCSSPTDSNNSQVTVPLERNTSPGPSLLPTEHKEFLTLNNRLNEDSLLMTSSPETVDNTHFNLSIKMEEGVQLLPPAFSTAKSLSSIELHDHFPEPSSRQETHHKIIIQESNNTAPATAQSNLADSLSVQTDSLFPITSLALHGVNTKIEDNVLIQSPATPAETIPHTFIDPAGDMVDPAGSSTLCEDVEGIEMKEAAETSQTEQGNILNMKSLESEDGSAEMWNFSERLHMCVQEIRDLLMNEGFYSLVDGLTEEVKDCKEDIISRNLIQLKHLPAVLHSLLQSASRSDEHKQTADEPVQSADIIHRNMETQTDSHLMVGRKEADDQNSLGTPCRVPPGSRSLASTHTLIFTRLDEEHNRRVLQRASDQGKIPLHVYQDASRLMSEYRRLRQERLRSLALGYVQYISWNKAEDHLQRQCLGKPHIKPTLSKIKELKHQVFLRWKEKREQSHQEKIHLSISLNQMLHGVQEDSGIFLIKPAMSWPGRSSIQKSHSQIRSRYRAPQKTRFPPLDQGGILCSGKSPPYVPKNWKTVNTDTVIRPVVVTPKLLEMDVHRYLCRQCSAMSRIRSSAAGLLLRTLPQEFVSIRQTSSFPAT
ncbi:uncharacterized protein [Pyxicephalus adspersus]|uniref:uncharacterized protein n=1 Tax=Pyxicephalus adspersus TaxID=30357 RepID=UPI003B5C77A7